MRLLRRSSRHGGVVGVWVVDRGRTFADLGRNLDASHREDSLMVSRNLGADHNRVLPAEGSHIVVNVDCYDVEVDVEDVRGDVNDGAEAVVLLAPLEDIRISVTRVKEEEGVPQYMVLSWYHIHTLARAEAHWGYKVSALDPNVPNSQNHIRKCPNFRPISQAYSKLTECLEV
jgi:hypothetical protein